MPTKEYQTTRIWKKTLANLQLIAQMTDETSVRILDRLVAQELQRLKSKAKREEKEEQK